MSRLPLLDRDQGDSFEPHHELDFSWERGRILAESLSALLGVGHDDLALPGPRVLPGPIQNRSRVNTLDSLDPEPGLEKALKAAEAAEANPRYT